MIRYQAKTVADALLEECSDADAPRFAAELFRHYHDPASVEPDAAFALLDTVLNLPMNRVSPADQTLLVEFATWWLEHGEASQKAAALRLFRYLLTVLSPTRRSGRPWRKRWRAPTVSSARLFCSFKPRWERIWAWMSPPTGHCWTTRMPSPPYFWTI